MRFSTEAAVSALVFQVRRRFFKLPLHRATRQVRSKSERLAKTKDHVSSCTMLLARCNTFRYKAGRSSYQLPVASDKTCTSKLLALAVIVALSVPNQARERLQIATSKKISIKICMDQAVVYTRI